MTERQLTAEERDRGTDFEIKLRNLEHSTAEVQKQAEAAGAVLRAQLRAATNEVTEMRCAATSQADGHKHAEVELSAVRQKLMQAEARYDECRQALLVERDSLVAERERRSEAREKLSPRNTQAH